MPASDVEREWSDILRKVRAGVLAVTSRVRASAGLTAEQAVEMDAELRLALKELGNDNDNEAGGAEGVGTAHATAAIGVAFESNLALPDDVSARPGSVRLYHYQRGIADAISNPLIERVSVVKSARIHNLARRRARQPCRKRSGAGSIRVAHRR